MRSRLRIRNARILTSDPARPRGEALLVAGNRIAVVGTEAECAALEGEETPALDARRGRRPAGLHRESRAFLRGRGRNEDLDPRGVAGMKALSAAVRADAQANPQRRILVAQTADYTFLPDGERLARRHLDRIAPDHPTV